MTIGGSAPASTARRPHSVLITAVFVLLAVSLTATRSRADEGGVSFWLLGQFGSFAAAPATPGFSLPLVYYHTAADAAGGKQFQVGGKVTVGLDAQADLLFAAPTYVFTKPVLGGQAAIAVTGVFGRADISAAATLTGPRGGTLSAAVSDTLTSVGDLYPTASLRWSGGKHNYLAYTTLGVPVGAYEAGRLANLGIGHWSVDGGGGYTYLDPAKGRELSAVLGVTYNFENPDTDYQNGVDAHLEWAASQFLSSQWHAGLVGYIYYQLTGDGGEGAVLGDFKSRVYAVGPQVGYFFPVGGNKWYANLKGYYEFEAQNRPEGWNGWITLSIPIGSTAN